jgi:tryptophan synthase alpha chain
MVAQVRRVSDIPCAVGFGIATPDQAKAMAAVSDGVIVGSAIVRLVAEHGRAAVPVVRDYVAAMKAAVTASS